MADNSRTRFLKLLSCIQHGSPENAPVLADLKTDLDKQMYACALNNDDWNDEKLAYVVGSTPYAVDWLSLTSGGAALTPEIGVLYIIASAGEYLNRLYRWNGTTYTDVSPSLVIGTTTGTAFDGGVGHGIDVAVKFATNTIYVDNKRTDTYTAVGTYNFPFKTIQAALNSIAGNSSTNRFNIKIATGAAYPEDLTINKDYVTLEGYSDTILSGNLTFENTAIHVKFKNLKLNGNASGAYTNAFVIDICDCTTATGKTWTFSCSVSGAYVQISGQNTLWYANIDVTHIKGVIANQGGYYEGTHTFTDCNGEFIGFENYGGTINIAAGSEIYIGASMCIDTVVNLASGATLHIDAITASKLATLNNNGGILDLTTPLKSVAAIVGSDATGDLYYRNASGIFARLPIGTTGQVLTVVDGLPAWTTLT